VRLQQNEKNETCDKEKCETRTPEKGRFGWNAHGIKGTFGNQQVSPRSASGASIKVGAAGARA
jgi:hypothetical protein